MLAKRVAVELFIACTQDCLVAILSHRSFLRYCAHAVVLRAQTYSGLESTKSGCDKDLTCS